MPRKYYKIDIYVYIHFLFLHNWRKNTENKIDRVSYSSVKFCFDINSLKLKTCDIEY